MGDTPFNDNNPRQKLPQIHKWYFFQYFYLSIFSRIVNPLGPTVLNKKGKKIWGRRDLNGTLQNIRYLSEHPLSD